MRHFKSALAFTTILIVGIQCAEMIRMGVAQTRDVTAEDERNAVSCTSTEVVVRNIAYRLDCTKNTLRLLSDRVRGDTPFRAQDDVKLPLKEGDQIVELALAPLSIRHLVAVVKVQSGREFDYYCLTFTWLRANSEVLNGDRRWIGRFLSKNDDLKILGLSGQHGAGSVVAILGRLSATDSERGGLYVSEGKILVHNCPWPPVDGNISQFEARLIRTNDGKHADSPD